MKASASLWWLAAIANHRALASPLLGDPHHGEDLLRRGQISPDQLLDKYDFVIVGGGQAGTVVASRLTEDPHVTVLVVEYGFFATDPAQFEPSSATSYNPRYMFNMTSAPQTGLNDNKGVVYAACCMGGGSTINGMMLNRGSAADYDSWEMLGNKGWGFDDLFPYFVKSSRFATPAPAAAKEFNMTWGDESYSKDGPIHLSFDSFQWPGVKIQREGLIEAGAQPQVDGSDGHAYGVIWYPTALDNTTALRSYAVSGYYDPASKRPNLHVLTGWRVDNLEFDDKKRATGIAITKRADGGGSGYAKKLAVAAQKEVIVAAGAIHSPQVLQRSGIGPKWLLDEVGIDVLVNLPGVGSNLQDHAVAGASFTYTTDVTPNPSFLSTNKTFEDWATKELQEHRSGPLRLATGNTAGEVPLATVDPEGSKAIAAAFRRQNAKKYLPANYTAEQVAGFKAMRERLASMMTTPDNGWLEMPLGGSGSFSAVLMKCAARGTVMLNTSDIYADPIVDYYTLFNPVDVQIMTSHLRFIRRVHETQALQQLGPVEVSPGADVKTDAQFETFLRASTGSSIAHNSGTCAMMPRDLGGVVDAGLEVYGVSGVSVIDASVIPMIPATHICSTVYAVAEKAADIIKKRHGLGGGCTKRA